MRAKKQPAKRRAADDHPEAGSSNSTAKVPKEVEDEFRRAQKRFLFNVEQIEERYCKKASGIVLDLEEMEYIFDSEECTAENDEELIQLVRRQEESIRKETAPKSFGGALISAPGPDPEERNQANIDRWMKLNKMFEKSLTDKRDKDEDKDKENNSPMTLVLSQKAVVLPLSVKVHRKSSLPRVGLDSVRITGINFGMLDRFHRFGTLNDADWAAVFASNHQNITLRKQKIRKKKNEGEEEAKEGGTQISSSQCYAICSQVVPQS